MFLVADECPLDQLGSAALQAPFQKSRFVEVLAMQPVNPNLLSIIGIVFAVGTFVAGSGRTTIATSNVATNPHPAATAMRVVNDLPDDFSGNQVHVMYVLPSDGLDEALDTNGTLERSVTAFQKWIAGQAGGQQLRLDTHAGKLDITFYRLNKTDASIASFGAFVRDQIESELTAAGFNHPNKVYAVYYGGGSTFSCGGGAWPPELSGRVAALYLKGTPPGAPACSSNAFAATVDQPGYLEFAMLHEILHTIGIVARCAPHHTLSGHVSDSASDIMYAGPLPWQPSLLDVGRDDYFKHDNPGCLDLAKSPYLTLNSSPVLFSEPNTNRAIALDSVTLIRDPFPLTRTLNFSSDNRTRIMLFAANMDLQPGENVSVVTAQAEDSLQQTIPITVEFVGKIPSFYWITQVNVILPDQLTSAGNILISVNVRGVQSNKVLVSTRTVN